MSSQESHRHAEASNQGPALAIDVLDDDPDFLQFIRGQLLLDGHEVRIFDEAANLYGACEQQLPDLVLLDINMGHQHGTDVLAELKRRWEGLCVVVVTGHPTMDTMRQTLRQQAFDYLAKPFSLEQLRDVIRQAVQRLGLGTRPEDRLRVELGRQIRLARTEQAWTLRDLSESSGVSVSQLSSIERGTHMPSMESLLGIATALKTRPSVWLAAAGF